MSVYAFLSAMPAILGVVGFIIFQMITNQKKGSAVTLKIIEKLRQEVPERFENKGELKAKQIFELLMEDNSIRSKISKQDFELLKQTLRQEHISSLVVYLLCALLFIVGTALFVYQVSKPAPLTISNAGVTSVSSTSKGLPVDLDNLKVKWVSSGVPEEVTVYIENIDTKARSKELVVQSHEGSLEFTKDNYSSILENRNFSEWNRARVVFQARDESFTSREFKLHVGMTVTAVNFGEKIKIAAVIDNRLVQRYDFEAKLVAWKLDATDTISFGGRITDGQQDYQITDSQEYNWSTAKLVYLGPDDTRLIRTEIVSD